MKFDLFIDGKAYKVELGIDEIITIEIDGKTYQAETKKTEDGLTVILDKKKYLVSFEGPYISINDNKHKIEVRNLRRGGPSWYDTKEEIPLETSQEEISQDPCLGSFDNDSFVCEACERNKECQTMTNK